MSSDPSELERSRCWVVKETMHTTGVPSIEVDVRLSGNGSELKPLSVFLSMASWRMVLVPDVHGCANGVDIFRPRNAPLLAGTRGFSVTGELRRTRWNSPRGTPATLRPIGLRHPRARDGQCHRLAIHNHIGRSCIFKYSDIDILIILNKFRQLLTPIRTSMTIYMHIICKLRNCI